MMYTGTWNKRTDLGGRLNNTTHETELANAAAELSFIGDTIELISEKQPWGGNADVYIDGVHNQTVSFYHDSPDQYQQSIFRIDGLTYSQHTLRIECNGDGWIYIDAIRINAAETWISEAPPIESPAFELIAPVFNFTTGEEVVDIPAGLDNQKPSITIDTHQTSQATLNSRHHIRRKLLNPKWLSTETPAINAQTEHLNLSTKLHYFDSLGKVRKLVNFRIE